MLVKYDNLYWKIQKSLSKCYGNMFGNPETFFKVFEGLDIDLFTETIKNVAMVRHHIQSDI